MKSRTLTLIITALIAACAVVAYWMYFLKDSGLLSDAVPAKPAVEQPATNEEEPTPEPPVVEPQPEPEPQPAATETPEPTVTEEPAVEPEPTGLQASDFTGKQGAAKLIETLSKALALESPDEAMELCQELVDAGLMNAMAKDACEGFLGQDRAFRHAAVGTFKQGEQAYTRYRIYGCKAVDLLVDLLSPADAKQAWSIATIKISSRDGASDAYDLTDSLQVTEGFITAVRKGDMVTARNFVIGKDVSDVTIAGLCMVFAEGGYELRNEQPIRNSFENDAASAYLVYLTTPASPKAANVGVELKKNEAAWRVTAVALDSLLSSYEQSAGDEGGRYFPLVKNPQGGDSLALFFAFDDSSLTPRSLRQLGIVAALLNEGDRKLDISGHTDDVGREKYNEQLSMRRANAVKEALIGFGVPAEKISTKGMGMSQPRRSYNGKTTEVEQATEEQLETMRAENRRAEIYLDFK